METADYSFFFGHRPSKTGLNVFSQWYPSQIVELYKNTPLEYKNAEQYMMAHKALLFKDSVLFNKIMDEDDPSLIKALGRKIKNFDADVWNMHKFKIVLQGTRLKFNQNPELLKRLMETGERCIVEASPYDKIWGIGLRASEAVKIPEEKWPGENLLGKALMIVRSENHPTVNDTTIMVKKTKKIIV